MKNAGSSRRTRFFGLILPALLLFASCQARGPTDVESDLAIRAKKMAIGGKDWTNPTPDTPESVKKGADHFQHHCQICHGLDGHKTGVPFADKMSPPVVDLGEPNVQAYTDGQLKWIIENGIRFTGMPGWKGILGDEEMWQMVRYIRKLPPAGSLGVPDVFKHEQEQHSHANDKDAEKKPHTHSDGKPHEH